MERIALLLAGVPLRTVFVLGGLFGLLVIGWSLTHIVGRLFDKFAPLRVDVEAGAKFNGDMRAAAASVRAAVPKHLILLCFSAIPILIGIMGPAFVEAQALILVIIAMLVGALWVWAWIEREFARPGWFVPPEVRGTPGLRDVRAEGDRNSPGQ